MKYNISYLRRKEIDTLMWDSCIEKSPHGLIYAYSFYLDRVTEHWDALVAGDYDFVMPLTWKRKLGIRYICTPPFVQRLGIFGKSFPDASITTAFMSEAVKRFSYIDADYDCNAALPYSVVTERTNFILPLHASYGEIEGRYHAECRVNIRKATARKCLFSEDVPVDRVISLYINTYGHYSPKVSKKDYHNLAGLADDASGKKMLGSCGVIHSETGGLLFGALIFMSNNRLYYLLGAPTAEGRKARAGYCLIDSLVQRYSGKPLVFDFEGSDIPGVADFYRKFGPEQEKYYHLHYNNLPLPVKLFKK